MKFIFLPLLIILTINPFDCTCSYAVKKDYKNADIVFKAKVASISKLEDEIYSQKATLQILKVYKGEPSTTIMTMKEGCSTPRLNKKEEWVFFISEKNGVQTLGSCNPSLRLFPKKFMLKKPERLKVWKIRLERNIKILDSLSKN